MRGKLRTGDYTYVAVRITPADAGKTLRHHRRDNTKKDHPRGCGENPAET